MNNAKSVDSYDKAGWQYLPYLKHKGESSEQVQLMLR